MASFLGQIKNRVLEQGNREWFSGLPQGESPDYVVYMNDFLVSSDYAAADWVVTETTAGATQALVADELNGAVIFTSEANDDDVVQIQSAEMFAKLSAGKQVWFETKLKISDATQMDLFVGLASTDTSIIAGTTDAVGFRKLDGSTAINALTEDNTSETATSVHTAVADTYVVLGFHWDGVNKVDFFVNRSRVARHTTNIEQTNKLALTLTMQNGEAGIKTLTCDYLYVCQER